MTAAQLSPVNGRIMLLNSVVVEPGGAGCACVHLAIASAELQRRILVPPALLRTRPIGTLARRDCFSALPVYHAVAENPRTEVPEASLHLGSGIWGQKMGSKGTQFTESERGVWFSWKRYGICTPPFQ